MAQKLSIQETNLNALKSNEASFAPLRERLSLIEQQFKDYAKKSEDDLSTANRTISELKIRETSLIKEVEELRNSLNTKSNECSQLYADIRDKTQAIHILEQSFEQSSRDLAVIEVMEKQEHSLKVEMKEQLSLLTSERNQLQTDLINVSHQLEVARDQLSILKQQQAVKAEEEEANRKRIATLMSQVQSMLTQEVSDSNSAIASVHEKMKIFRQRMLTDLQREKRLSASLQDKIDSMKHATDDIRRLSDENNALKAHLSAEELKVHNLQLKLDDAANQLASMKLKLSEREYRLVTAEEKTKEATSALRQSSEDIEKKIRLKTELEAEEQRLILARKENAMKIHYENELDSIKSRLRQSFSISNNESFLAGGQSEQHQLALFQAAAEKWAKDREAMTLAHEREMNALEDRIKKQYLSTVKLLQDKLHEAGGHIEKLKSMVDSNKEFIAQQNTVIKQLNAFKKSQIELMKAKSHNSSQTESVQPSTRSVSTEVTLSEAWEIDASGRSAPLIRTPLQIAFQDRVPSYHHFKTERATSPFHTEADSHSFSRSRLLTASKATPKTFHPVAGGKENEAEDDPSQFHAKNIKQSARKDIISDSVQSSSALSRRSMDKYGVNDSLNSIALNLLAEDFDEPMRRSATNIEAVTSSEPSSTSTTQFYEAKLKHERDLAGLTKAELELERAESLKCRQREMVLHRIIHELHKLLRSQLAGVKNDLAEVRTAAQAIPSTTAMVIRSTVSGLGMELSAIFDAMHRKQKSDFLEAKIELSNAHSRQLNSLEESYIQHINELSKKHANELSRMHNDVMGKAERVISMVGYTSLYNSNAEISAMSKREEEGSADVGMRRQPAFASVLRGLIEAVVDLEIMSEAEGAEISSLVHAHFEPSIAATAAAKSMLSQHINARLRIIDK